MKLHPLALGVFLVASLMAGCQADGSGESGRYGGKPVVALASISAADGTTKDLSPSLPYTLPDYPISMLRAGIEGLVDVRLGIRPDGSVDTVGVLKSTAQDFEGPVRAAVKTWQFPQLRREPSDAGRGVELVCRLSFSINESWRYSIGGDAGGAPKPKGDMLSAPPAPSRAPVMTPR